MNRRLSLATRAFLLAFVPMALTLIVSFVAVNKAVEARVKDRLRDSLRKTEAVLSNWEADYNRRSLGILSVLAQNPSLKAAIGLQREARDPNMREQAIQTLVVQLNSMGETLDYDLLLVEDAFNGTALGVVGTETVRIDTRLQRLGLDSSSLLRVQGTLYETVSIPVNLDYETLGTLILGQEFDIQEWGAFGHAALIENGEILLTNFPPPTVQEVVDQLRRHCGDLAAECEIDVGGETYLILPIRGEGFGEGVRLLSFQSIDAATSEFMGGIANVFPIVGGAGMLLVFLFSVVGSRTIARPLVKLISHLRRDPSPGSYSVELPTDFRAEEVNVLAREFTRAAGAVRDSERRLDEATEQFIESMTQAQDARDPYTAGHSERVSVNSTTIARLLGLPPEEVEIIRIGARLHDLGKVGIPDAVLRKPGRLTLAEYTMIQRHPQIGKAILEKVERFQPFLPIVELHHENPDGSGYPYGLREDDIPMGVRIVHVADVFDAVTSDRAYRPAMSDDEAWDLLLRGMGTLFDPTVVEALWTIRHKVKIDNKITATARPHENDSAFYSLPVS